MTRRTVHRLTVHAVTTTLAVLVTVTAATREDRECGIYGLYLDDVVALAGDRALTPSELAAAFDTTEEIAPEALYEAARDALAEVEL